MTHAEINVSTLVKQLGISRAYYYKLKKLGRLEEYLTSKGSEHAHHISEWISARDNGIEDKPWSNDFRRNMIYQINKFFRFYSSISTTNLINWLSLVPPSQHSLRKDRHTAVSVYARFLARRNLLTEAEYNQIRALYPRKSSYYLCKQRLISTTDFENLMIEANKGHCSYQRLLNQALLVFMSESGLRISETCKITFADLHFSDDPKQAFISVKQGKGGKSRLVPFSKKNQHYLQLYLQKRPSLPSCQSVFLAFNPQHGYTSIHKDCISRRFRTLSINSGIPFSAHSLRHYRITQWANNAQIPITVVQKWAGHSSLEVTQRYIHIRDEEALKAAFE